MEYQVSNRAKKVTLGLAVLGLIMLVFGFFQQKDYVYVGELIDEHSLTIKYNGEVTAEKEKTLQEKIKSTMEAKGYSVTIEKVDAHHHDHADGAHDHSDDENNHSESGNHHSEGGHEHANEETTEDIVEENVDAIAEDNTEVVAEETTETIIEDTNVIVEETIETFTEDTIGVIVEETTEVVTLETTETVEEETTHASDEGHHGHHGPTIWMVHLNKKADKGHSNEEGDEHQEAEHAHSDNDHNEASHDHSEHVHHAGHGHHEPPANMLAEMIESGKISFFDSHYRRFWSNLLVNGFFFFGIALGALFYLALHYATESGWGVVLLRVMEGIMSAMPIGMAVLLVVFIAGTLEWHHIYPWMIGDTVAHDDIIYGKTAYLNKPFFWIRVVAYFATFYIFMKWFKKKSRQEDQEGGTDTHFKMYRRGALFLVFFAVFSSTMSWDFIMSIDTHWYSTLFGWYVFSGIWLSGMVMVMMVTLYLRKRGFLPHVNESHIHDVGKWMFALSFLWSYLWFSQFMLIWYANIPEEAQYFYERIENYKFIYFGTFIINFVFPMVFLMSRDTKRSTGYLIVIGLIIFIGHWLDVFNMVMPGTLFDQWGFGLLEIGMFLIFLGVFVYAVLRSIAKAPLLQKNHPYLEESKHHDY